MTRSEEDQHELYESTKTQMPIEDKALDISQHKRQSNEIKPKQVAIYAKYFIFSAIICHQKVIFHNFLGNLV